MIDFKIRRGPSSVLFSEPGVINPKLIIEDGCWYLCTDTAELFLGTVSSSDTLTLKRINGDGETDKLYELINELQSNFDAHRATRLFEKISSENDLPSPQDIPPEEFNTNITYYIPTGNGTVKTFIFDEDTQSYLCNTDIDEDIILDSVVDTIETVLDDMLEAKLPVAIKRTLESTVIFGGTA